MATSPDSLQNASSSSWIDKIIGFCLYNKLVVLLLVVFSVGWGLMTAPFDWDL